MRQLTLAIISVQRHKQRSPTKAPRTARISGHQVIATESTGGRWTDSKGVDKQRLLFENRKASSLTLGCLLPTRLVGLLVGRLEDWLVWPLDSPDLVDAGLLEDIALILRPPCSFIH